jgi:arabinogalactan endo-1,4-beta-galactosidase
LSQRFSSIVLALAASSLLHCSGGENTPGGGAGGQGTSGNAGKPVSGAGAGGTPGGGGNGAAGSGGAAGTVANGAGQGAGGSAIGGTGGNIAGGSGGMGAGAGNATGGRSAGGAGAGGASSGGRAAGGAGSATALPFSFYIGADVTFEEPQPEATRANLLTIMQDHGFNYIRLRTFVDPKASDGYDKQNGYAGLEHTIAFGKQIKDAGMGFLLDFHYSDNWADPGKQCVPIAWQSFTTIEQMATAVHDYTKDAIEQLIAGGARPDMVQVGNEITPGMLIHRCDSGGQPTGNNPVTGAISNWTNLGSLLKAGVAGVKEVDPGILISLHIDRGDELGTSRSFITNAQMQGVEFDAFGESCYTAYQGQPSEWENTFSALADDFPELKFFVAEYGPEQKAANDIMFEMADQRGLGTFNWEPTTEGAWNDPDHVLLRRSGSTYDAQPDLPLYDQMKIDYASRL